MVLCKARLCIEMYCCVKNKEYTDAMLVKEHNHPADVTGVSVEKCTA